MRERFILLKRKHDLNERESFLLDTWLGNLPALKEAYELKEEFYWIWDTLIQMKVIFVIVNGDTVVCPATLKTHIKTS